MNERNQEQQMESTAKLTAEHAQKLATSQTQQFLDRLKKGDVNKFFESKQLTKLDKFAENMDILADGKLDSPKPYSKIANMPENQRAEALQKTSENLRDNMTKVRGNLTQNLGMYSKQQQAELGLLFKGIDMQGGMDKFMSQHYGLTEDGKVTAQGGNTFKEQDSMEKLTGDSEEKKGALGNINDATKGDVANKSNPLANNLANHSAKSADRDTKPIISGGQAPDVSAPQKGLNIGGR